MKPIIIIVICIVFMNNIAAQTDILRVNLPKVDTLVLTPSNIIDSDGGEEISGFVKSRYYKDIFWGINDSGDPARVVAFKKDGSLVKNYKNQKVTGLYVGGAINADWEDITIDNDGFLYICDVGNNCNCRRDLVIYKIIENDPQQARGHVFEKIFVKYPDQTQFPAPQDNFNFDAEGVFWANEQLFIFSKNRSNSLTTLYSLKKPKADKVNTLKAVATFDIGGMVTGADASADGTEVAVLTYTGIWIFKAKKKGDYFNGDIWYRPIKATQVESICFDGNNSLIIIDELGGKIFEVDRSDLVKVK